MVQSDWGGRNCGAGIHLQKKGTGLLQDLVRLYHFSSQYIFIRNGSQIEFGLILVEGINLGLSCTVQCTKQGLLVTPLLHSPN